MKPKERFLCAVNRKVPDRVPVFANLTPQVARALGESMRLPCEPEDSFLSTRISHTEILLELGNDAVGIGPCREVPTRRLQDGRVTDEWGIIYDRVGLYDEAVNRPLASVDTVDEVNDYHVPDPLAESRFELAKDMIKRYSDEYAIIGDLEACLFHIWHTLCSFREGLKKADQVYLHTDLSFLATPKKGSSNTNLEH
jgi:uroporphyrinogen decarboxylase